MFALSISRGAASARAVLAPAARVRFMSSSVPKTSASLLVRHCVPQSAPHAPRTCFGPGALPSRFLAARGIVSRVLQSPRPAPVAGDALVGASSFRRSMSSSASEYLERAKQLANSAYENRIVVLTVSAMLVALYGFYRVTVKTMGFLLNVSDATIFNIGFTTGLFTAACAVAAGVAAHRYASLSVEGLRRVAMAAAQADARVTEKLGKRYAEARPPFRAYVFEPLRDAIFGSKRRSRSSYFEVPARRCRLMLQLQGTVHDGMLAVEGYKRGGEYHLEAMSLFVTDTGEKLQLKGDASRCPLFEDVLDLKMQQKIETEMEPPPP